MLSNLFYLVPASAVIALTCAFFFFRSMKKKSEGSDEMKKIAS